MRVALAFAGHFERNGESWKHAWPFFERNFVTTNPGHDIFSVFHTWDPPPPDLLDSLRPIEFEVTSQVSYSDSGISRAARSFYNYDGRHYNNLKNRLESYTRSVALARKHGADVVFLTRFDVVIGFPVVLDDLDLSGDIVHTGNWDPVREHHVCDHYFLGSTDALERLVSLREMYDIRTFDEDSDYVRWMREKTEHGRPLASKTWVTSHTIIPWWMSSQGLARRPLGAQDKNTWLVRQALRSGIV